MLRAPVGFAFPRSKGAKDYARLAEELLREPASAEAAAGKPSADEAPAGKPAAPGNEGARGAANG
jgi:hypothetical protein